MKNLIVGSISALLLSTISPHIVRAEQTAYNPTVVDKTSSILARISPVGLVNSAYRGQLQSQGIPSYNDLKTAYQSKQITAVDIVRSAVKSNLLPQQALADSEYINAVAQQLDFFGNK
ncbi:MULTISPECIES: hypothetical protein [Nostocales]|uniref:DUF4168 domain-containing protein n=2 Tax=Nostocales TaxID=1161 RepID=A0ABW8WZI5_9CYAN